ncbi:CTP synthase [Platysternon megacephalum]|uniref:CTP synthase n=1 Tax=Platysternon megacephalum TaxID=55544 RepID=A0A4D9DHS3_9SAUR|nr:CTP synthase [Platysternon megacephalum]
MRAGGGERRRRRRNGFGSTRVRGRCWTTAHAVLCPLLVMGEGKGHTSARSQVPLSGELELKALEARADPQGAFTALIAADRGRSTVQPWGAAENGGGRDRLVVTVQFLH